MRGPFRIEGYAIVSCDGMIADATGLMPNSLKFESDQRFYEESLEQADVVVNGRLSHEGQAGSPRRRRLILTRQIAGLAPDPGNPHARLWNPAGASLEEACAAIGCREGTVAVIGGTYAFGLFLKIGYNDFFLAKADRVLLPGGVPVFPQMAFGRSPEDVLSEAGLQARDFQWLDEEVSLVEWTSESVL